MGSGNQKTTLALEQFGTLVTISYPGFENVLFTGDEVKTVHHHMHESLMISVNVAINIT